MKILISGLGGDVAQSIAKAIRSEFHEAVIVGLDISDRNAAVLYCDSFHLAPKASDVNYLGFIRDIFESESIDFFIPCTESELKALIPLRLEKPFGEKIISCSQSILEICLDKLKTYEFLARNGFEIPWYSQSVEGIKSFPCIFKLRSSSGSRDVRMIRNQQEAEHVFSIISGGLFQQFLADSDQEITCGLFRWENEHFECIQLLRELKAGTTSWAKKVFNAEVEVFCRKLSELLDLRGSLNVQLRLENGRPMILEINPRFSSTVHMRHLLGFKDLCWTLRKFRDEKLDLKNLQISTQTLVRTFDVKALP